MRQAWQLKVLLRLVQDVTCAPRGTQLGSSWSRSTLHYTASAAEQGVLKTRSARSTSNCAARITYREAYTALLADYLTQAGRLFVPPGR